MNSFMHKTLIINLRLGNGILGRHIEIIKKRLDKIDVEKQPFIIIFNSNIHYINAYGISYTVAHGTLLKWDQLTREVFNIKQVGETVCKVRFKNNLVKKIAREIKKAEIGVSKVAVWIINLRFTPILDKGSMLELNILNDIFYYNEI